MSKCAFHVAGCEPCDETEGWKQRACSAVYELLGQPGVEPKWACAYALTAQVLRGEQHPESQLYWQHFSNVNPVEAHG